MSGLALTLSDRARRARALADEIVVKTGELVELARGHVDLVDWIGCDVRQDVRHIADTLEAADRAPHTGGPVL